MLRLRDIKTKDREKIWPPSWDAPDDSARDNGVLIAVRRIGHRLSLTIEHKKRDYVTLLNEWKPPPSIDAVEAALVTMLGKSVSRIGNVEVGVTSPPTGSDSAGY